MKFTRMLFVALSLLALVAMIAPTVAAQDPLIESVCLVTDLGRVNDGTFNQFAYEGMVRAAEDFGLDSTFIETQAQTDYTNNIQTCLSEEYDAIVTVGFLIADATREAAIANPDVFFIGVDQFYAPDQALPNLVGLQFREDQAGFVVGALAALMSESGTVAGVYGIDIPPVVKFRNGFEQGVRYVNPEVETLGVYIDDFVAPDRGAAAAEQFIGEGADVIFGAGGPTGSGGITFAAQAGVFVIGVDQDEYGTTFGGGDTPGAENIISSALKRVDNAVYQAIEILVGGSDYSDLPGIKVFSALNDGVGFAPAHDSPVPTEVTEQVQAVLDGLKAGTIVTGVDPILGGLLGSIPEVVVAATEAETPEFTTLLAAVTAADLGGALSDAGPFTVFAPTDAAFAAALEALGVSAEDVLADTELLTSILTYHVVAGVAATSEMVVGMSSVTTLQGSDITIEVVDGGVVLNGSINVIAVDIPASNGVIHVIDGVLLPPM
ncbi:MAG: BMP family ABC transporter substrate-binding protein [Chloroflexota bacterium]|nr:BMP family ABC transporter substrate-binding protein [Chloroflexota bacterium]